jgi:hypothetical protein
VPQLEKIFWVQAESCHKWCTLTPDLVIAIAIFFLMDDTLDWL